MKKGALLILAFLALHAVAAGQQITPTPKQPTPPLRPFFVPKLVITDIKVKQDGWFFIFTVAYKNVGTGALPKASDLPVKPDFKILIDGREINKGFLYIPETAAGPGWENPDFLAGRVRIPSPGTFEYSFFLGNAVTVKINENLAVGPTSDSQTYNLRQMALNTSYDIMIAGVSLDWAKQILTITVRVEGQTGAVKKFQMFTNEPPLKFNESYAIVPGQHLYTITRKPSNLTGWGPFSADFRLLPRLGNGEVDVKDIDHRNNWGYYPFHR